MGSATKVRREERAYIAAQVAARRLRVAELTADPARAHYAPLVERGEDWSDENIRYHENPDEMITCAHLQPIERAIRRAGIPARRDREADVSATCRIGYDGLKRNFAFAAPARYAEFYMPERAIDDNPTAYLICDEHKCIIYTIHPEKFVEGDTRRFPCL